MKILCHVDPWCIDQFKTIAGAMASDAEIVLVSGYRKIDQTGLSRSYYGYVDGAEDLDGWADARDAEVIARCRLMRSLDPKSAHRHVRAMRRAAREMLASVRPEIFLCESIDQFLHDVLFQEANDAGVASFGMIRTFVNGYYRISERGEMRPVREPPQDEVSAIREKLSTDHYIPSNLISLKRSPLFTYLRIMVSNNLRVAAFFLRRHLSGEKYNYHYWVSERGTREQYQHILPRRTFGTANWREELASVKRPIVYVPLQHFPEATVDYWADDLKEVAYPQRLYAYIDKLRQDYHVLIKEHPGVWGFRKPSFYRPLEGLENVTICQTGEPSQNCLAASDAVLVWTGSVGFEAALRGKPVLTVCAPYYATGNRFMRIALETSPAEIGSFISRCTSSPIEQEEADKLVAHLMSGLIPGRFQNDGTFDPGNQKDVEDAARIGRDLRRVYDAERAVGRGEAVR
jgi:hypothetical protein